VRLRGDYSGAAAEALDVDPVGHREDVRHVVTDQDDGQPTRPKVMDQGQDVLGLAHAECRGRLVQDDDLATERGRAGDGHGLPLPT
jgi:hypothetical protein